MGGSGKKRPHEQSGGGGSSRRRARFWRNFGAALAKSSSATATATATKTATDPFDKYFDARDFARFSSKSSSTNIIATATLCNGVVLDTSPPSLPPGPNFTLSASSFSKGWDQLPPEVQDDVLSRLPFPLLTAMRTFSASWNQRIDSLPFPLGVHVPRPVLVVLPSLNVGAAYLPSRNRWLPFPHLRDSDNSSIPYVLSSASLLLAQHRMGDLAVVDILSPRAPIVECIPPDPFLRSSRPIALVELTSSHYRIVSVKPKFDVLETMFYDSLSRCWNKCLDCDIRAAQFGNAVRLDDKVFSLSTRHEHMYIFDLSSRTWVTASLSKPPNSVSHHLFLYQGIIWMVAGVLFSSSGHLYVKTCVNMREIRFWKFDTKDLSWTDIGRMPTYLFQEFAGGADMGDFVTVDRNGILGFYGIRHDKFLFVDFAASTWWWAATCHIPTGVWSRCNGHFHALVLENEIKYPQT